MSDEYTNSASQALLATLEELSRRPFESRTIASVMEATGVSRDATYRSLRNLQTYGWAAKTPGGWRLTPGPTRMAQRANLALHDLHRDYLG